ncbi:hypothetical protein [Rudaea sp.]|uniref:hypothetical protein n=1 Tax=Rudaea sp. TaxID=2136325 RepID=UPI002ED34BF6
MDAFNYLSVLISIILGLAITQILKGVRGVVLSRARVIPYWPTFVFAGFLFIVAMQGWWALFELRQVRTWTFPMFALVVTQTTSLYLLAALVLPDFFGEQIIDLRKHYFAHRRIFFSLIVVTLLISLAKPFFFEGHLPNDLADVAFHLGWIALAIVAAVTKREWFHKAMSVASALTFLVYIALLFMRLR